MTLPDVLQWIGLNRKTGLLELERGSSARRVAFREGKIVACALDDSMLLGHFLLSAGQIRPDRLQEATEQQRRTGKSLARVLIDESWISESALRRTLAVQAEEIVYGLFDWIDANFAFHDNIAPGPEYVEADLAVDEVLLNGLQRLDETKMIRKVFTSSGIVLAATGNAPPAQIANSGMARRILQSIDGRRTLLEVLRHAQASEFLVLKFLYHLFHKDVLQIVDTRPVDAGAATLVDELSAVPAVPEAAPEAAEDADLPPGVSAEVVQCLSDLAHQLTGGIEAQAAAPLAVLDALPRILEPQRPDLEPPIEQTEHALVDQVHDPDLRPSRVPVVVARPEQALPPEYEFLLALIDGRSTIEQILCVSPFSDVTVMQVLEGLVERGIVALRDQV